ncbi:MAG: Npt1/Npt2 family nucleotide transporter [Parachlamydiales bacterium]|jgi:AAA family ATP:ADP antiporter
MIKIKNFFSIFNKSQKIFIASLLFCVFFISCDYAIIRPASTSIFISNFTSKLFPYCWILGVPFNLLVVYLYNRFLPKIGCLKTFLIFVLSIIVINASTGIFVTRFPMLIFLQFLFKDAYILLAFKQAWSMIHSTINTQKAKFLYGFMFGVGGLGSVFGGLVSGYFAVDIKSSNLFLFSIPLYLIIFVFYKIALKNSNVNESDFKKEMFDDSSYSKEGFSLIRRSPYLKFILFIVVFMQISTAFLDYQFNVFLEKTITNIDLRTAYTGKLTSIINSISTAFQFFGGFLLINYLGLRRSHMIVPLVLAFNSILFLVFPSFAMITMAFATIKTMDYSFFGILREMLYIPLKTDEKYRAKAIIDVFAYRSAKAFASLFLIFIQNITVLNLILLITILSMIIYFIWARVVSLLFNKNSELVQD